MPEVSFDVSAADEKTILAIAERAHRMGLLADSMMTLLMDLEATHANGCPLKLEKLLAATDFNFSHDVCGIQRHIDRETGQLRNCFLPRYYDPKAAKANA